MRYFALLLFAALALHSAPAMAQRNSSSAIVACADSTDLPICLLQAISLYPVLSLSSDPDFANAPEVVRAVEGDVAAPIRRDVYTRAEVEPALETARAVDAAIEADRRGASPEQALRSLRAVAQGLPSQSIMAGQIVTRSGAAHRVAGYSEIWRRYRHLDGAGPSESLARAALAAWEEDLPRVDSQERYSGPLELALAYEVIGDNVAVNRVSAQDPVLALTFRLRRAVAGADLDGCANATLQYDGADVSGALLKRAVEACVAALIEVGRTDVALSILGSILERSTRPGDGAMARFFINLPRDETVALIRRLDRRARGDADVASAQAAALAVAGWMALGDPARANVIVDLWRPRADAQVGRNCGGDGEPPCFQSYMAQMLRWADRLNEAAPFTNLGAVLEFDFADGYGVSRLDERLVHFPDEVASDNALERCVQRFAHSEDWPSARICLDRLMSGAARRPLRPHILERLSADPTATGVGGPYNAAQAAFTLASLAEQAGQSDIAEAAFADGVSALRGAPAAELMSLVSLYLRDYARALLQKDGRLPAN